MKREKIATAPTRRRIDTGGGERISFKEGRIIRYGQGLMFEKIEAESSGEPYGGSA